MCYNYGMMWDERIRKFLEAWDTWPDLPGQMRVDKGLKAAGFRDVIKENMDLKVEVDRLKAELGERRSA